MAASRGQREEPYRDPGGFFRYMHFFFIAIGFRIYYKRKSKNALKIEAHIRKGDKNMNKIILVGRLTKDPEIRYQQNGDKQMAIAKFGLAVNRDFKKEGQQEADFFNVTAFGKNGEFAEKYLKKGGKILVEGRVQTGSYVNKEGQKVYTTDVIVDRFEFVDSKHSDSNGGETVANTAASNPAPNEDFMDIPDDIGEDVPWGM